MSNEPTRQVLFMGRPIEDLTREELIQALTMAAIEAENLRQERQRAAPYINYGAMLMGAKQ